MGIWTCVLGPAKPECYPLSGGWSQLFLVTVSLLPWVMYMFKILHHYLRKFVDRPKNE